jgi:hypothetical protein
MVKGEEEEEFALSRYENYDVEWRGVYSDFHGGRKKMEERAKHAL